MPGSHRSASQYSPTGRVIPVTTIRGTPQATQQQAGANPRREWSDLLAAGLNEAGRSDVVASIKKSFMSKCMVHAMDVVYNYCMF
jgi:hypothetical protein